MCVLENRDDVMQEASRMKLRILHFARGVFPLAVGKREALPVNRFFMPLVNPNGGACFIADDEKKFPLKPGCAYFIPLHYPARVKLDEQLKFISIQFTLEIFDAVDLFSHCNTIWEIEEPALTERAKKAFETPQLYNAALQVKSLVNDFAAKLISEIGIDALAHSTRFAEFQKELEYLREHCSAQIGVAELAEIHGMSREAYSRKFSRKTGMTVKQFISRMLLNRACRMLSQQRLLIREVAFALDFSNEFYFSRFFKKNTGMSPVEYYRMYRK